NAEHYLADAVERLTRQSNQQIEIVVVDDGSSDRTAEIARHWAAQSDRVVFVPLAQNVGVARAREQAVLASRGEFLWFVDADDQWSERAVETMLAAASQSAADVVVAGAVYVFPDDRVKAVGLRLSSGPFSAPEAFRLFLTGSITGHLWNKLFRRSLARSVEFTPARVHSDQAMVAQFLAAARSVVSIEDVVYRYVLRSGSIIRSGTPRSESLTMVSSTVARAAERLDPLLLSGDEYGYYRLWFIAMSAVKDATSGVYPGQEAARHLAQARAQITLRGIRIMIRRREIKRLALVFAAKTSVPLYRYLMSRGNARA
ncbi:MAG: glycosyltransferase family 2 protein, partial [Rhodoglobus sp.]